MENQQHKMKRAASNPHQRPTHEDLRNLLKKLQKVMDKLGYGPSKQRPKACPEKCQAAVASVSSNQKEVFNVRTDFEQKEVPVFNTYEEFHKTVLQSFENISVVLNIEGRVVFISQNVSPLLGHHPEDIVGKSLLNILIDEEKKEISQKIVLSLPLAQSVGRLIEFCCYLKKGNVGQDSQKKNGNKGMYKGMDKYEYVKFILYLQDSYDESFVFFGNYGPNSRNIWSSTPRLLWEEKYYLVGTISVLRTRAESEHPVEIEPPIIIVDSDDDSSIQSHRLRKRCRRNEIERNCQAENVNMEHPESDDEVQIIDIRPATQQMPFELVNIRTPSQSSACTTISIVSSTSTTTSNSSTDCTAAAAVAAAAAAAAATAKSSSSSSSPCVIEPKNMLEPVDMEFEVSSEFLLSDSQEEQSFQEHEKCSDEDVEKPLEEAKGSNFKEHVIDDTYSASSDEDCCIIIEDVEDKKSFKTEEVTVDQQRGHQKTVETAPKHPKTVVQPVRPEAVVGPMVRKDLPACDVVEPRRTLNFQRPLLGGRFPQLCGPQVRTQVYDLNINRGFEDELPSYRNIEEEEREREQCEYGLAQHIEMLHNLPYERSTAQQQIVQGQQHRVYQPRDQEVTVINDVGPLSINFFENDNSEYPRNETHRFWDDHVDHTPPTLHVPLTRSHQRTSVPYQPVTTTHPSLTATNHPLTVTYQSLATVSHLPSARSQHLSARSHFASSDYQRENGPHFVLPGQGNSGYFLAGEDIDFHP